jgi:hypothetical protein
MRAEKCALFLLFVLTAPAVAQDRKKPEIKQEGIELKGLIAGVQGGVLQIVAQREHEGRTWQEPWLARVLPGAKIDIAGFAQPDFLRPGIVVRLTAEFDMKSGVALEPVTELSLVTPRLGDQPGIFADDELEATERKKGPPPKTAKLRIFDAITGVKENTLIFKKYRVEVAPDAVIKVDVADPSVLSRGDKVEKVKGWYVKGRPGAMFIEDMDVSLAMPLAARKKPTPGTAKGQAAKSDLFDVAGDEATGKKAASDENKDDDDPKQKGGKKGDGNERDSKETDKKRSAKKAAAS